MEGESGQDITVLGSGFPPPFLVSYSLKRIMLYPPLTRLELPSNSKHNCCVLLSCRAQDHTVCSLIWSWIRMLAVLLKTFIAGMLAQQ